MPAINEPLELILKSYPFEVREIRNESYKEKKGVWWVKTQNGMKILKKVSYSEDTLKYILQAIDHLSRNGVHLPAVNNTSGGKGYVCLDNVCYVLIDAIEGRNPSYSSSHELYKVVNGLAQFHKASAGFFPSPGTKPKYHLGSWIEDYTEQIEDIKRFYDNEQSLQEVNKAGKLVIKEFPYFYERAQKAIEGLKGPMYWEWGEKTKMTGGLCHQDFAAGNLIITPDDTLFVLDTDSITVDIPARDIRKLLNKVMKKHGKWDMDLTRLIFKHYQSENPLSASEWEVVKLDLMYPHLFIGAVSKYYYKRDKDWSEGKYLQRIAEMAAFEKTVQPILDNFVSIKPA